MLTSNDPTSVARARRRRILRAVRLVAGVALGSLGAGCGGRERATLHRDVRLEIAHDPPLYAPADAPFVLGISVTADPPLAPGSAHLWYDGGGGWVRSQLEASAGTDRMEAQVPAFPRGGKSGGAASAAAGGRASGPVGSAAESTAVVGVESSAAAVESFTTPPVGGSPADAAADVYRLLVRAPVAEWASWLRNGGAALALLLVLAGAALAVRWRPAEPPGRPAGVTLEVLGVVAFALALVGAVCASFQATGNPLRDVQTGWWVAGLVWLPILAVARALRRSTGGSARRARRLAVLAAILAVPGAVALLVGLAASI